MHNLEELIAEWRKTMPAAAKLGPETLDELENHLRENVAQLVGSGMAESEAFQRAVAQLGGARMMASEFQKLDEATWFPIKLVVGLGLVLALAQVIFVIVQLEASRINFLLAGHVFLVGMGYSTTFLTGALGVCFVGQRCFSDFPSSRMRSLTGVTFILGCVAASLTAVGYSLA